MATQFYAHSDTYRPVSPLESTDEQNESSWYRHSAQTGDLSSGRSASPNSSNRRSAAFIDSKSSSLDPRRITPTLHASLVSEILNLRRELENKNAFIDDLETNLHSSKLEIESINDRLTETVRDSRATKRQADDAEKHLYQVTEDLIKERDEAVATNQDLKSRLNALTVKSRRQEEDFERWQQDLEKQNRAWEIERHGLERRVHTTENQLRAIVDEIETRRTAHVRQSAAAASPGAKKSRDSGFGNDSPFGSPASTRPTRHQRNISVLSAESENFLVATPPRNLDGARNAGKSLADELDSDGEADGDGGDDASEEGEYGLNSNRSPAFETPTKARRLLGLDPPQINEQVVPNPDLITQPSDCNANEAFRMTSGSNLQSSAVDGTGAIVAKDRETQTRPTPDGYFDSWDVSRYHTPAYLGSTQAAAEVKSSSTQTDLLAVTDREGELVKPGLDSLRPSTPRYRDASTQIDPAERLATANDGRPRTPDQPLLVPSIAIHPPSSAPNSPRRVVLPPHTSSVATQTDPRMTAKGVDANVQTEEIRIDLRRFKAHLSPETDAAPLTSSSTTVPDARPMSYQSAFSQDTIQSVSVREITDSLESKAIKDTVQRSVLEDSPAFDENPAGFNDVRNQSNFWGGQSARSSSLLMSLQDEPGIKSGHSSMLGREMRKSALSEASTNNETYMLPPPIQEKRASYNSRANGNSEQPWSYPVNGQDSHIPGHDRDSVPTTIGMRTSFRSRASSVATNNSSVFSTSSQPPPLPIPDRSSSRVHSDILEEDLNELGLDGSPMFKRNNAGPSSSRPQGVRKTRSSNSIRRTNQISPKRRRRAATRLAPIQSIAFENDLEDIESSYELHTPTNDRSGPYSEDGPVEAPPEENLDTPLVDAIASAMVGEWMWKYSQKRKSFGMVDSGKEFGPDDKKDTTRQKRWIWLSPYERTIMWSSKQPLTGAALMGKAGRKLHIKTVLDVKDDNPLPKGANYATCYERSIVILTPDRPLKITASSRDRHYFWLMALSFLANPAQGPPQIPRVPASSSRAKEDNKSQQLEDKDSVIEQSISKVTSNQSRNFSAPAMSSFHHNNHLHPYSEGNRTVVSGPAGSTPSSSTFYSHPDMPNSVTDMPSLRKFRRGSSSQTSAANTTTGHARRRSNTGPIRLPTSLQSLISPTLPAIPAKSSRRGTLSSTTHSRSPDRGSDRDSNAAPADTNRQSGMIRMTAFVDPAYQDPYAPPLPSPRLPATSSPHPHSPGLGGSGSRSPLMLNSGFGLGIDGGGARSPALSSLGGGARSPGFGVDRARGPASAQGQASARPFSPGFGMLKGQTGRRKRGQMQGEASGDAESVTASVATDERKRLGYVFDEEGRDPFRGF